MSDDTFKWAERCMLAIVVAACANFVAAIAAFVAAVAGLI